MKNLIYLFVQNEEKKSLELFKQLSNKDMLIVKGGDGDPQDILYPPVPPIPPTKKG